MKSYVSVMSAVICVLIVAPAWAWDADKMFEASSGLGPEIANSPFLGWGDEFGGDPVRSYQPSLGGLPAWLDICDNDKIKYRSDNTWGTLNASEELGLIWNMQMLSNTGGYEINSDGRPELLIRNGYEAYFRYSAFGDRWFMGSGGMVRTEGGVDFSSVGGGWEMPMPRGEWHTVRMQTYPGTGQMGWEIWIDEQTDDAHHMKGYTTTATGSSYVQWGVTSSDKDAVFATNYFYWSQGDSITPIPEPGAIALLGLGCLCLFNRRRRA